MWKIMRRDGRRMCRTTEIIVTYNILDVQNVSLHSSVCQENVLLGAEYIHTVILLMNGFKTVWHFY